MSPALFDTPKVFQLTRSWKRRLYLIPLIGSFVSIALVAFLLTFWPLAAQEGQIALFISLSIGTFILISLPLSLCWYLVTRPIRHIVTDKGITFSSFVYSIYTPWENIRSVGISQLGTYRPPALLLLQPAVTGYVGDGNGLERATIQRHSWLTTKKYSPDDALPLFFTVSKNWQESDLGRYIRHYAPQAFSQQET